MYAGAAGSGRGDRHVPICVCVCVCVYLSLSLQERLRVDAETDMFLSVVVQRDSSHTGQRCVCVCVGGWVGGCSGNYHAIWDGASFSEWSTDFAKAIVCMVLAGPLLTGYTQTINDWYDREIDAINEPNRPIPSGAISEGEVIAQIWALLLGGLGLAYGLDVWAGHEWPAVLALAVGGSFISYIYSAPPLKLKQSGWIGNYALGSSYIALPWWCGQVFFNIDSFNPTVAVLTILYSWAGLGIAIVNDFKSIEGDRALGLMSLPVQFGIDKAKWICVGSIDLTQIAVAAYLASVGETKYAAALAALILPQMYLQAPICKSPL